MNLNLNLRLITGLGRGTAAAAAARASRGGAGHHAGNGASSLLSFGVMAKKNLGGKEQKRGG
jgi:hypothetical protein